MEISKLEPIRPLIAILARRMKSEFPRAVAFDDRQEWEWSPQEGVPPGNWALTVGVAGGSTGAFAPVPDSHGLYVRVVEFSGPPRVFLAGWDPEAQEAVCVSLGLRRVAENSHA